MIYGTKHIRPSVAASSLCCSTTLSAVLLFGSCASEKDEEKERVETFQTESDPSVHQVGGQSKWSMDQSKLNDDEKSILKALENGGTINGVVYAKNNPTDGLLTLSDVEFIQSHSQLSLTSSAMRFPQFLVVPENSLSVSASEVGSRISGASIDGTKLSAIAMAGSVAALYDVGQTKVVKNATDDALSVCAWAAQKNQSETNCARVVSDISTNNGAKPSIAIDQILCRVPKADGTSGSSTLALTGSMECFPAMPGSSLNNAPGGAQTTAHQMAMQQMAIDLANLAAALASGSNTQQTADNTGSQNGDICRMVLVNHYNQETKECRNYSQDCIGNVPPTGFVKRAGQCTATDNAGSVGSQSGDICRTVLIHHFNEETGECRNYSQDCIGNVPPTGFVKRAGQCPAT
jgi:hypothetical protein